MSFLFFVDFFLYVISKKRVFLFLVVLLAFLAFLELLGLLH